MSTAAVWKWRNEEKKRVCDARNVVVVTCIFCKTATNGTAATASTEPP